VKIDSELPPKKVPEDEQEGEEDSHPELP